MATLGSAVELSVEQMGPWTARGDGSPVNLTGYTLVAVLTKGDGTVVASPGTCTARSPQATYPGQFYYTPAAAALTRSSGVHARNAEKFGFRLEATASGQPAIYFPNAGPDIIEVYAK